MPAAGASLDKITFLSSGPVKSAVLLQLNLTSKVRQLLHASSWEWKALTTCRSEGVAQPWDASSLGVHLQHQEVKTDHSDSGEEANSPSLGEAFKAAPFFSSLT